MKLETEGIVLSEMKTANDRCLLTILTRDNGIIPCFMRTGRSEIIKYGAAVSNISYSEFTIHKGRSGYNLNDAFSKKMFFKISEDIGKLALVGYFDELLKRLIPPVEEKSDPEYLRLMLNSLFLLNEGKKTSILVKAVFELRIMALSGYMPDLLGCRGCGIYDGSEFFFDYGRGCLWCPNCHEGGNTVRIEPPVLNGIRAAMLSDPKKIFSFSVSDHDIAELAALAEKYTLLMIDEIPDSLNYYKTMSGLG